MIAVANDAAVFLEQHGHHDLASAVYLLLAEAAHLRSINETVPCHRATRADEKESS